VEALLKDIRTEYGKIKERRYIFRRLPNGKWARFSSPIAHLIFLSRWPRTVQQSVNRDAALDIYQIEQARPGMFAAFWQLR